MTDSQIPDGARLLHDAPLYVVVTLVDADDNVLGRRVTPTDAAVHWCGAEIASIVRHVRRHFEGWLVRSIRARIIRELDPVFVRMLLQQVQLFSDDASIRARAGALRRHAPFILEQRHADVHTEVRRQLNPAKALDRVLHPPRYHVTGMVKK